MSFISRKLSLSLALVLSLAGGLLTASPAAAIPADNGTYTGTSTTDGFTATPNFGSYSDCSRTSASNLAGGSFYFESSVLNVGGLNPGEAGSVTAEYICNAPVQTVVTIRFSGQALQAALTPDFGSWRQSRAGAFAVQIMNFDASFTYSATSTAGRTEFLSGGFVFVEGLPADTTATVTVVATKSGYASGSASATGKSLKEANRPSFGALTRRADGFDVQINNFDANFYYQITPSRGTATVNMTSGLVSVRGLSAGQLAYVDAFTMRNGYASGLSTTSASALGSPGLQAALSAPVNVQGVPGSFAIQVTNHDPAYTYAVSSSSGSASMSGNTINVTGASTGSATLTVVTLRSGFEPATSTLTHTVPGVPATPQFPSAFATNATTAFVTWGSVDGATGYTVTANSGGPGCVATSNSCTITGLTSGSTYTFSIVATNSGLSSPAATTGAVVMGDQLVVGGSVSGSTWKVGTSVTASPLIIGQYSILNYQWYRCSSAVGTQVAPPACEAIGGASAPSYILSAADVGKFVTAHLSATGGVGVVTKTLSNGQAALSSDAAGAPNVDPEGKPVISNIPDKQVSVVGGTEIVINGTGFAGVTSVTVNGVAAKVIKATETSIVVSIPASTTQGLVDLVVTTPKGATTATSALAYVATPVALPQPVVNLKVTKTTSLKPFVAKVVALTAVQKKEIKAFVSANSKLTSLKCIATTSGVKKSSAELKAAVARAKNACTYAKSLNAAIKPSFSGIQGKPSGKVSKLVKLTLSN